MFFECSFDCPHGHCRPSNIKLILQSYCSCFIMVPGKRKVIPVKKLEYTHLMKYEKNKNWKVSKIKTVDNKNRKREERLAKKLKNKKQK